MPSKRCRRRHCLHCNGLYKPDARNRTRQRYCSEPDCRRAGRKASQARWLAKPGNAGYFRGAANTERNRAWREANPGYWRRRASPDAQQDSLPSQDVDGQKVAWILTDHAQQDAWLLQQFVFVGLIAKLTDSTQQETIDGSLRRLHALGRQVMARPETDGNLLLSRLLCPEEGPPGRRAPQNTTQGNPPNRPDP
jgi:hypothetical protein